jgi:hypothetical protein
VYPNAETSISQNIASSQVAIAVQGHCSISLLTQGRESTLSHRLHILLFLSSLSQPRLSSYQLQGKFICDFQFPLEALHKEQSWGDLFYFSFYFQQKSVFWVLSSEDPASSQMHFLRHFSPLNFSNLLLSWVKFNPYVSGSPTLNSSKFCSVRAIWCQRSLVGLIYTHLFFEPGS